MGLADSFASAAASDPDQEERGMNPGRFFSLTLSAWAIVGVPASAAPGGYVARLEAQVLLQTLNADLLSHDSATAVLQGWCDAHGPGGVKIVAQRVQGQDRPLPEAGRLLLGPGPVRYRRVLLACGAQVLSEADNWYLPERLTPAMNRQLDESEVPFGVVVRPLDFRRRTLAARLLYAPLQPGWETGKTPAGPAPPIPAEVLQHTAILSTPDGAPFSYLVETYTGQALGMALPRESRSLIWRLPPLR
jgi:chorismate-pyruvate lyase